MALAWLIGAEITLAMVLPTWPPVLFLFWRDGK